MLSGVSLWLILQSCPQKLKPCEKPCWVVKCNEKDQVNITMSNSLIGSGGTDNDKGYTHGYDEWPECVVCMCSCFKPLDISADRLLMLAFIWFLLSFTYCHGSSHPFTLTCISGSSLAFHTRPSKETVAWHISMWIWLNMNDSVGRGHQLWLAVLMFLEWLGRGWMRAVLFNTIQHNTCRAPWLNVKNVNLLCLTKQY